MGRLQFLAILSIGILFPRVLFATPASQLRVVVLADSNARNIGPACDVSASVMDNWLQEASRRHGFKYTIEILSKQRATFDSLQNAIAGLVVRPTENILFYYCGHGAMSPSQGHYFTLSNERREIKRSDLRNLLLAKRAKATLIFSDACSNFQEMGASPAAPEPDFGAFPDLFIDANGIVDVTAAAPGEYAWFSGGGGIFSDSLFQLMSSSRASLDANRDGRVTWDEGFNTLRELVGSKFADFKGRARGNPLLANAKSQSPILFDLPFPKWVAVQNTTKEKISFTVQYMDLNMQWTNQMTWQVPVGESIRLDAQPNVPVVAIAVNWSAVGESGAAYGIGHSSFSSVPAGNGNTLMQTISILSGR